MQNSQAKYQNNPSDGSDSGSPSPRAVKKTKKLPKLILISEEEAKKLEQQITQVQELNDAQFQEQGLDDQKIEEHLSRIHLNLIPRQKQIKLEPYNQIIPIIVQLQTIKAEKQKEKANIDLVCVVDVSGSMEGKKLDLVKDSLRYIQKILGKNDRIAIVIFDSNSDIILPWTLNQPENKKTIKKSIKSMKTRGSTNIASGVGLGLKMIRDRKYKNPITCMFVLSDGQDDNKGADDRCKQLLKQYLNNEVVQINTFGYGSDHDAIVMNNIASLTRGKFTFIENINKVSQNFIFAMSGMLSVASKDIKITLKPNQHYKINKLFGEDILWDKIGEEQYQMKISYLLQQESKEFVIEIELPKEQELNLEQDIPIIATLEGLQIDLNYQFKKITELQLQFVNIQENIEKNQLVEINYLRAKAGEAISLANDLAEKKQFDEAQQIIKNILGQIQESQYKEEKIIEVVKKNLSEILENCKPKEYEKRGRAKMLHQKKHHLQRERSMSNSMEWDEDQQQNMSDFEQGNLQLSCSSGSNNNSRSNSPVVKQVNKPQKKKQKRMQQKRRNSVSGSDSDNSNCSYDSSRQQQQQIKNIRNSSSRSNSSNSH